ncbi:MAG: copper resistance protein CopC [Actinomycetota bacterium]|nr:copper resistance protein CopC [Actinomycetota bacterium]
MVLGEGPAAAHAVFQSSRPDKGATVGQPPETVTIEYSEPPIADAVVNVRDGCRDPIDAEVEVAGTTLTASVPEGQPGR